MWRVLTTTTLRPALTRSMQRSPAAIFPPTHSLTAMMPFSHSALTFAKKPKRRFKQTQKSEYVEVDDDDDEDDDDDDRLGEKEALAAKGILHKGAGEAEEVVDDGLPKDYKRKTMKLPTRRIDTLLNRTTGRSSGEVEKMILTGRVRVNEQVVKKKAYNVMKRDDIEVWLEQHPENPLLAQVNRVKIVDYVLKQHGYDIDVMAWNKMLVENWRYSEIASSEEAS